MMQHPGSNTAQFDEQRMSVNTYGQPPSSSTQQFSSSCSYTYSSSSSSSTRQIRDGVVQEQQASSSKYETQEMHQPSYKQISTNPLHVHQSFNNGNVYNPTGNVLKNLETGLVKSSHYIKESNDTLVTNNEAPKQDRKEDYYPRKEFNLEKEVEHMMPNLENNRNNGTYTYQQNYQISSANHKSGSDDERPGSRLKQNIDELDNLLIDLDRERNISSGGGTDYADTYTGGSMQSEDYSESTRSKDYDRGTLTNSSAKKPPSPLPRKKIPHDFVAERGAPSSTTYTSSQQVSTSYRTQETSSNLHETPQITYSPPPTIGYKPTGAGSTRQPVKQASPSPRGHPDRKPEGGQPNFYTKFSSVKQTTSNTTDRNTTARPPTLSARSPTPQGMPKQVDELMSEFDEYDKSAVDRSVSPKPMFSSQLSENTMTSTKQDLTGPATASADPPQKQSDQPVFSSNVTGPSIYYPPGFGFSGKEAASSEKTVTINEDGEAGRPTVTVNTGPGGGVGPGAVAAYSASGGQAAMAASGTAAGYRAESRKERCAREEKESKQGAAMIPICLPLCCAAPCVIM